jgi:hypothetical protein
VSSEDSRPEHRASRHCGKRLKEHAGRDDAQMNASATNRRGAQYDDRRLAWFKPVPD